MRTRRRLIVVAATLLVLVVGWWFSPYLCGMIAAWADGTRGHHEVKVFGLPSPWAFDYARLARERYGVEVNAVAGCLVTQDLVWYVRGYNSVAEPRIRALHGKDVLAESAEEARAAWELAHSRE